MGMISDLLSVSPQNSVNPVQSFNLVERVDPLSSMLKQGEEIFIKEANGQIKRIKEIKIEDGFKIPQAIIEQINKLESINLEQMNNPNFKCPIDVQEMNKNLVEHIEFLHQQALIQKQDKTEKESILNNPTENDDVEPDSIRRYCEDTDIEELILDSTMDETVDYHLKQPSCNLVKTESYLLKDTRNSNSKTKYLFIYTFIVFPLFMIYYFQNKKYKDFNCEVNISATTCSSNSSSWRNKKLISESSSTKWGSKISWNFVVHLWQKVIGIGDKSQPYFDLNNSQTDLYSYLQNIDECNLSPTYYILNRLSGVEIEISQYKNSCEPEHFDKSTSSFDIIANNNDVKKVNPNIDGIEVPCKYCNDYNEYHCPNHYHLYSTDEASSSEAEFICLSTMKSGKSKNKKKVKEVKKNQHCMLSNFAKLFTQ